MKPSSTPFRLRVATAVLISGLFTSSRSDAESFTLPVLPDTQVEVHARPEMFISQLRWLAANQEKLKIPIVLHIGDIVNYNHVGHWRMASAGFKILDEARLPYALAVGNHDTGAVGDNTGAAAPGDTHKNLRDTSFFNSFFPPERFAAQRGQFEPGKSENAYSLFEAGGVKWVVITLEFCARLGPVMWAEGVMDAFPDRNAVIVTHHHLNNTGKINQTNDGYGDMTCQAIFDRLSTHANLLLVLSGHTDYSASRTDVGAKGNTIYQILQDRQGTDSGGGYIRLLEIDPAAGRIAAHMYSPYYDIALDDKAKLEFTGVKFVQPAPAAVTPSLDDAVATQMAAMQRAREEHQAATRAAAATQAAATQAGGSAAAPAPSTAPAH